MAAIYETRVSITLLGNQSLELVPFSITRSEHANQLLGIYACEQLDVTLLFLVRALRLRRVFDHFQRPYTLQQLSQLVHNHFARCWHNLSAQFSETYQRLHLANSNLRNHKLPSFDSRIRQCNLH